MPIIIAFLLFMLLPLTVVAQAPAPQPQPSSTDASIEELVRIIENEETRAELIERLQQTAGTVEAQPSEDISFVQQLARYTQAAAQQTAITLQSLGRVFGQIQRGFTSTDGQELRDFLDIAASILLVGLGLAGGLLVFRLLVSLVEKRIADRIAGKHWSLRLAGIMGTFILDLGALVLAWATGYFIALFFAEGGTGQVGINQSLLLNAFLLVELSKLVVRTVLAPRFEAMRLLAVSDQNANYWSFWLERIISLIGYTFLLVSPLVASNLDRGLAAAVQVLVMATATTIGVVIVLQSKNGVRNWLVDLAGRRSNPSYSQLLLLVGRVWHVLAISYLLALLVLWFANPYRALPFMLSATVQSFVAIVVGALVFRFVSRFVSGRLHVPHEVQQRLPLLETRLQSFVPAVMQFVQWAIVACVLLAIVQVWSVFDIVGWLGSENGQTIAGSVLSAILIIGLAFGTYLAVSSWIEYRLNPNFGKAPTAREKTLLNLFKNAFTIALVVFSLMLALGQIGVNIAPLLAGAGVIGLAIGFGAQKLVQDIITGIFIQFENVMNEGDVVEVAGKSGVVEKLTIRSVTIRDLSGTVHLIPFSSVDQVSNMVRGFSFYVAEFEVSRDSQIEGVKQAMQDAFAMVMASEHKDVILDDLDLQGLIALTPQSMSLRARIKTLAGEQWGAGRLYSELVMRLFDERGIATPTQRISYVSTPSGGASDNPLMKAVPQPG